MKPVFFLVLIIFFAACHGGLTNSLKGWNLKGPVANVTAATYEPVEKFGEITEGRRTYGEAYKAEFDKNGFITERNDISITGAAERRVVFTFSQNKVANTKEYDTSGNLTQATFFEYSGGDLKKMLVKNINGAVIYTRYVKTNGSGRLTEEDTYNKNGVKTGEFKNEYSGDVLVQMLSYDSSGTVAYKTVFEKYNENNDPGQVSTYENATLLYSETNKYTYDSHNNWIQKITYNDKGKPKNIVKRTINYY